MKSADLNKKHRAVMKFAEWTMDRIGIKNRPQIDLTDDITVVKKNRSYGATTSDGKIWVYVGKRTPADAMRTLCHEILHAKQFEDGVAYPGMSDKTEQHVEDEANARAGRILRKYGKIDSTIYESTDQTLVHSVADSLPQAYAIPQLTSSNDPYLQYKFSVALASARGKNARDSDNLGKQEDSNLDKYFNDQQVVVSYDPELGNLIGQALTDIGLKDQKVTIGVKGSQEPQDTGKVSPVIGFRKRK